jgi:hypothetical protein
MLKRPPGRGLNAPEGRVKNSDSPRVDPPY